MKRLILPILLITLPFLISCPTEDPFSALEGINLLSTDERAFTGWTVEYDITTSFDFLAASDGSSITYPTTGLDDATSAVYRLELVNLMQDGGFEAGTTTGTLVNGGLAGPVVGSIGAGVPPFDIDGDVYYFDLPDPQDHIDFDMNTYLLEYSAGGAYVLRFDLKSLSNNVAFEQHPGESGDNELWSSSIDDTTTGDLYHVPIDAEFAEYIDSSFSYNASKAFTIGRTDDSSPVQKGYIDNLRVCRADTGAEWRIEIPYSDSTGDRNNLLSGYYKFTVKILQDPEVSPHTNGPNRMRANGVTVSIKALQDMYGSGIYSGTAAYDSSWSSWTEISVITDSLQIDQPQDESTAMLSISILPSIPLSGTNLYDAGSLLIAEPVLEYSATGVF